jgi:hypothetical protein
VLLILAGCHSWNKVLNECLNCVTALNSPNVLIKFLWINASM